MNKDQVSPRIVWVIDDDETTLMLAKGVLAAAGFTVMTFASAGSALEALGSSWPDIIVADVMMPGIDGFEFCRSFRAIPGGLDIPILVMTSLDDPASIERAYQAGATEFTVKPLNWTIDIHRLHYMLRAADTARNLRKQTLALKEQIAAKEKAHAELSELQEQLFETSRRAGMAEVATGVLHNVGNVLNSINVSATLLRDRLRTSNLLMLIKVASLLEDHASNIGDFLTTDPKGKLVPTFIIQLARDLQAEHSGLQKEYDALTKNLEHIKATVTVQQGYARVTGQPERISLCKLAEDTVQINIAGLTRHEIIVERQYGEVPEVLTDKHRVLQILVNLVRNAQIALVESGRPDKKIVIGVEAAADRRVRVSIADNGVGIPSENLSRLFAFGFTTRKDGHGFGLHSAINAAKELGGQLAARSAGAGQGAIFVLELPVR